MWAVPPGEEGLLSELYAELLDQAVTIPSAATDRLCRAAKSAGAYVVMGISERNAEASGASMYNTLLYDVFELIVHHEPRPMIATREQAPPSPAA